MLKNIVLDQYLYSRLFNIFNLTDTKSRFMHLNRGNSNLDYIKGLIYMSFRVLWCEKNLDLAPHRRNICDTLLH